MLIAEAPPEEGDPKTNATAVVGATKKRKNRKKNKPADIKPDQKQPKTSATPTQPTANASNINRSEAPLFETVELRSGATRTVFNTNDTTTMLQPIPTQVVHERLDTVLDAVRQLDTTCDQDRCRTKTTLMYQECEHCRRRFCFKHGLPEVHGCGDAVRRVERERFMHPVPAKTRQAEKDLKEAHTRMEQKLKDMKLARKAKPPVGKKPA